MKRVTQKRLTEFITKVADKKPSNISDDNAMCYHSKVDGSYMGRVGMEDHLKFLLKKGIIEQIQNQDGIAEHTANIGFNPEENKWYGWSHRAIYGFTIGSECKNGHAHYQPANKKDFSEDCLRFWGDLDMDGDTHKMNPTAREETQDGKLGVYIEYTYSKKTPNKKMRGHLGGMFSEYPETYGKGEWTAKTMEDAKQMAIDFAMGVS